MGRKITQHESLAAHRETSLMLSIERERIHKNNTALKESAEGRGEGISCEFKDFCNRLYYIDGKCRCMSAWRRTPGLVLPASC